MVNGVWSERWWGDWEWVLLGDGHAGEVLVLVLPMVQVRLVLVLPMVRVLLVLVVRVLLVLVLLVCR